MRLKISLCLPSVEDRVPPCHTRRRRVLPGGRFAKMAVHEFMHPRNRYRQRPDFQELIKEFPELNEVASVDLSGKVKLDYKNKQAVELLSKCLLARDFRLKLELPSGKLVPTLPLRLNYIHWLEDIGSVARWSEREVVRGIDIGCGASCIYPLLAVVQSNKRWHMVAIEKAEDSLASARANVIRNELQQYIDVRAQNHDGNTILLDVLQQMPDERFEFCMCNPPFFDSTSPQKSKPKNRTGRRREPSNASTGSGEELCTEGGEVQFIGQIIEESLRLKDRVGVYTTMIGHKRSYEEVLHALRTAGIHNVTTSCFCQGNTTRWAVAWSFDSTLVLPFVLGSLVANGESLPQGKRKKGLGKPISCAIFTTNQMPSLQPVIKYIVNQLQAISIDVRTVKGTFDSANEYLCELSAQHNTWSHQRRKRRAERTHVEPQNGNGSELQQKNTNSEKKLKLENVVEHPEENLASEEATPDASSDPYLRAALQIQWKEDSYYVALQYISGIAGRDGANQILQYLKNTTKSNTNEESSSHASDDTKCQ
uniref:U6 small nuclear RNA (adenine-(43)-N(6))-methyltransferase n=1 Tax=Anopheles farauti TaxID=69004 RepID=A0A182Q582_9DIPT